MDYNTLVLFIITETLLSLTPGPAVLLVLGLSVRHGFKIGFGATLGILATNAVFFTLAALGLGAAIIASHTLFTLIKWIGAAYLVYLGVQMIIPLIKRYLNRKNADGQVIDLEEASQQVKNIKQDFRRSFWKGFVLQGSNPKNIVFFVAILPQFINPEAHVASQLFILGVVSVLLELPILAFYGLASSKSAAIMKESLIEWIEGIAGGLLITMGGLLAAYKRS
jgi:threonine/homoserine/homoserine lactone efflux protein